MKILIYPFDRHILPIVKHTSVLENYEEIICISPNGWGHTGKDIGTLDASQLHGITMGDNFDEALKSADDVLFVPSDKPLDLEKIILPKILSAAQTKKNIHCALDLSYENYCTIQEICIQFGTKFNYYSSNLDHQLIPDYVSKNKFTSLSQLDVPIIMVMGVMEQVSKFDTQVCLKNYLTQLGYNVAHVTSRPYGAFINAHSCPNFLFNKSFCETEKITAFNQFIKGIECNEQPDIIIVGVPGGIIPVDNKIYNNFGITAFEITQAVTPDITIICAPIASYQVDYFKGLEALLQVRFGSLTNAYLLDNVMFDRPSQIFPGQYSMLAVEESTLDSRFNDIGFPVFTKSNKNDCFTFVLDKLAENAECAVQ